MPGTGCMCSIRNVWPDDFEMTSVTTFGIDAEALGDPERLADGDRRHARDQIVAELHDLAAAHRAHMDHVGAHG